MGVKDLFKIKEFKSTISTLEKEKADLQALLTPEHRQLQGILKSIEAANQEKQSVQDEIDALQADQRKLEAGLKVLKTEKAQREAEIVRLDDEITFQEFGLYTPMYAAMSSDAIKLKLLACRERQKEQIKNKTACDYSKNWLVNGSRKEGLKMTEGAVKLVLRSFNNECESTIDKVKFNNFSAIAARIRKSYDAHNKLNRVNEIKIRSDYLNLKIEELGLVYEYAVKKEQEKEEARLAREALKEQKKLEAEAKREREKIEKEKKRFLNAYLDMKKHLDQVTDPDEQANYQAKVSEIEESLASLDMKLTDLDYRVNNTRAGYVYIISNIGSFGEGVYKIGVTRRLDPYERVRELGDASVPFKYDVHAMIFSDDAPALETALHRAFAKQKVNLINGRREFFRAKLEEVEAEIRKSYSKTFEMSYTPPAEEYRLSCKIRSGEEVDLSKVVVEEVIDDDEGAEE